MELQYKIMSIWLMFASACGIVEAFFFHKKKRKVKVFGRDIHEHFTLIRGFASFPLFFVIYVQAGVLEAMLMEVLFVLVFPFFHDGFYYTTRELLRKGTYPSYWIDQSTTTSAKFSFSFTIRVILLIAALLMFPY